MRRIGLYFVIVTAFSLPARAQVSLSLVPPSTRVVKAGQAQPVSTYNGIDYHGGLVMNQVNGVNVYLIWYGSWSNNTEPAIVTDFLNNLSGTAYFNINSSYYDFNKFGGGVKDPVVNRVTLAGSTTNNYSFGNSLTDQDVGFVVAAAMGPDKFPIDPNGVYMVLTSKDIEQQEDGVFCGWHSHGIVQHNSGADGTETKIAWIGDSDRNPTFCQVQNPSPNNNPAADTAVNFIAHELSETVTDPLFSAWWVTSTGFEMGDLCEGHFGTTKVLPNGSSYNLIFGTRPYLVQQLWVNARGGYCALALDE